MDTNAAATEEGAAAAAAAAAAASLELSAASDYEGKVRLHVEGWLKFEKMCYKAELMSEKEFAKVMEKVEEWAKTKMAALCEQHAASSNSSCEIRQQLRDPAAAASSNSNDADTSGETVCEGASSDNVQQHNRVSEHDLPESEEREEREESKERERERERMRKRILKRLEEINLPLDAENILRHHFSFFRRKKEERKKKQERKKQERERPERERQKRFDDLCIIKKRPPEVLDGERQVIIFLLSWDSISEHQEQLLSRFYALYLSMYKRDPDYSVFLPISPFLAFRYGRRGCAHQLLFFDDFCMELLAVFKGGVDDYYSEEEKRQQKYNIASFLKDEAEKRLLYERKYDADNADYPGKLTEAQENELRRYNKEQDKKARNKRRKLIRQSMGIEEPKERVSGKRKQDGGKRKQDGDEDDEDDDEDNDDAGDDSEDDDDGKLWDEIPEDMRRVEEANFKRKNQSEVNGSRKQVRKETAEEENCEDDMDEEDLVESSEEKRRRKWKTYFELRFSWLFCWHDCDCYVARWFFKERETCEGSDSLYDDLAARERNVKGLIGHINRLCKMKIEEKKKEKKNLKNTMKNVELEIEICEKLLKEEKELVFQLQQQITEEVLRGREVSDEMVSWLSDAVFDLETYALNEYERLKRELEARIEERKCQAEAKKLKEEAAALHFPVSVQPQKPGRHLTYGEDKKRLLMAHIISDGKKFCNNAAKTRDVTLQTCKDRQQQKDPEDERVWWREMNGSEFWPHFVSGLSRHGYVADIVDGAKATRWDWFPEQYHGGTWRTTNVKLVTSRDVNDVSVLQKDDLWVLPKIVLNELHVQDKDENGWVVKEKEENKKFLREWFSEGFCKRVFDLKPQVAFILFGDSPKNRDDGVMCLSEGLIQREQVAEHPAQNTQSKLTLQLVTKKEREGLRSDRNRAKIFKLWFAALPEDEKRNLVQVFCNYQRGVCFLLSEEQQHQLKRVQLEQQREHLQRQQQQQQKHVKKQQPQLSNSRLKQLQAQQRKIQKLSEDECEQQRLKFEVDDAKRFEGLGSALAHASEGIEVLRLESKPCQKVLNLLSRAHTQILGVGEVIKFVGRVHKNPADVFKQLYDTFDSQTVERLQKEKVEERFEEQKANEERERLRKEQEEFVAAAREQVDRDCEGTKQGDVYVCKHCDESFRRKDALRTHVKDAHVQVREFTCKEPQGDKVCGVAFPENARLRRHVRETHKCTEDYINNKYPSLQGKSKK